MTKKAENTNATVNTTTKATTNKKAEKVYFKDIKTLADVRSQFLEYAQKSKNAQKNLKFMEQYVRTAAEYQDKQPVYNSDKIWKQAAVNAPGDFSRMIFQLLKLEGVSLRMEGRLLWASGNTKENKEILKHFGFQFKPKVAQWVWNDVETRQWRAAVIPAA
jgi:hypothetical protein